MRGRWVTIVAAAMIAGAILITGNGAVATHEPADKVSAAGATTEVVSPGENVVLLQDRIRTSSPSDLILGVTAECAITTELTTTGNDYADAFGQVRIWITIDNVTVPVASDDTQSPGRVVFCQRAEQRETTLFDDEDATIRTFNQTRQANAFSWMALNLGNGIHTIRVVAELTHGSTGDASAMAAIGKRTLIIEPTKAANDEDITAIT